MGLYARLLIGFVIVFSALDVIQNKHYHQVWGHKTLGEKFGLIFYLLFHNALYFCIYASFPYLLMNHKSVPTRYIGAYLMLLVAMPIHWATNGHRCWFTVQQNMLLEIPEDTVFRDPHQILFNLHTSGSGSLGFRDQAYYGYLVTAMTGTACILANRL